MLFTPFLGSGSAIRSSDETAAKFDSIMVASWMLRSTHCHSHPSPCAGVADTRHGGRPGPPVVPGQTIRRLIQRRVSRVACRVERSPASEASTEPNKTNEGTVRRLLCLSNGHGEDTIAVSILRELQVGRYLDKISAVCHCSTELTPFEAL